MYGSSCTHIGLDDKTVLWLGPPPSMGASTSRSALILKRSLLTSNLASGHRRDINQLFQVDIVLKMPPSLEVPAPYIHNNADGFSDFLGLHRSRFDSSSIATTFPAGGFIGPSYSPRAKGHDQMDQFGKTRPVVDSTCSFRALLRITQ